MNPGDVIAARFELLRRAGAGGMSEVFYARDRDSAEPVALKRLLGTSAAERARFEREARLLAALDHPAIVRHVAHGTTADGEPFLAMEWLEGEDLSSRLARGALAVDEATALATRTADALAAVHARGGVHRDIKPANVFLPGGDARAAKVLDFGIARTSAATRALTSPGAMIGTPGYMAPEQARGEHGVDARADVFALGSVLFECLTGRPAFGGETIVAVLAKVLLDEVPDVRTLRPEVPAPLSSLVGRMLAKDPAARPPDGAAVHSALGSLGTRDGATLESLANPAGSAIGHVEQRLLCVALVGPAGASAEPGASTVAQEDAGATRAAVRALAAPFGAHAEVLVDGTVVITLEGGGAATDQAARAARCALAFRAAFPGSPCALATGRGVFSGALPLGDVIDRASRLLSSAPRDSVRTDELTAGLLTDRFDLRRDGDAIEIRGAQDDSGAARPLLGRVTPCVGRDRELRALSELFDESVSEPAARAALVTAPAGVGKSRVRHEFVQALRRRPEPPTLWVARGDPVGAGSAFGMAAQIVRQAAGLSGRETLDAQREALCALTRSRGAGDDTRRVAEFLGEIAGAPFPDHAASESLRLARGDSALMHDLIARAWEDLLAAEISARPLVLLFEDLHWGDLPTVRLVDGALRVLRDRALLVVAFARPEVSELFPRLWAERGVQEIRLPPLTRKSAVQLARAVLGPAADAAMIERVADRSAGNAFYLEELVRAAAEGRGMDLPETVVAMAQARLEALDAVERAVLRAASVYGQSFTAAQIEALTGAMLEHDRVASSLEDLTAREILVRAGGRAADATYGFRHALLRDAAYEMLTDDGRALAHRLAGAHLESMGLRDALVLAEHFEKGGDTARAMEWYASAATLALEGNDFAGAIQRARRAVALGARGESLAKLWCTQAEANEWLADWEQCVTCAARAAETTQPGSATWYRAGRSALEAADMRNEPEAVAAWLNDDVPCAESPDAEARCLMAGMRVCEMRGRIADSGRLFRRLMVLREGAAKLAPQTLATIEMVTWYTGSRGSTEPMPSSADLERALERVEASGDLRSVARLAANTVPVLIRLGHAERGLTWARRSHVLAEKLGLPHVRSLALNNIGTALMELERWDEARVAQTSALAEFRAQGNRRLEITAAREIARIDLEQGRLEEAERGARETLGEAVRLVKMAALATLARALLGLGRAEEAERHALQLIEMTTGLPNGAIFALDLTLEAAHTVYATGRVDVARATALDLSRQVAEFAARLADEDRVAFLARKRGARAVLETAREWGVAE